jgi:hypothetical protein
VIKVSSTRPYTPSRRGVSSEGLHYLILDCGSRRRFRNFGILEFYSAMTELTVPLNFELLLLLLLLLLF